MSALLQPRLHAGALAGAEATLAADHCHDIVRGLDGVGLLVGDPRYADSRHARPYRAGLFADLCS